MYAKKNSGKKVVATLLAIALLIGGVIGGTMAYLIAAPKTVTNTFVPGEIGELTLTESDEDKEFMVVPGVNITKDPKVSFSGHNVDAYVFLKIEHADWNKNSDSTYFSKSFSESDHCLEWYIADGWDFFREVDRTTDIYCRKVLATEELNNVSIIKNDTITVSNKITKEDLTNYTLPNLTFTAYAIQASGYDASLVEEWEIRYAAWAALNPPANDDEG